VAKEWRNLRVAASGLMRDRSLAVLKMFSKLVARTCPGIFFKVSKV
jgi:hypothetical protein